MPRLEDIINERQLKWIGKVVRMDKDRLPRKLLFSWMHTSRSVGGKISYGGHITKLIKENLKLNHDIAIENHWGALEFKKWLEIAKNKKKWRDFIAYCPAIRDGHLYSRNGLTCNNEKHKKSHEQKVERALRKLKSKMK